MFLNYEQPEPQSEPKPVATRTSCRWVNTETPAKPAVVKPRPVVKSMPTFFVDDKGIASGRD
jgi:hypothetical protein